MTTTPEQPAPAGVLVAVAALHVLLAQNPDLAALPLSWGFDETDGIYVRPPYLHPDTAAMARRLASALDAEPLLGSVIEHDGVRSRAFYLDTTLAGIRLFAAGHAPVEAADGGK